MPSAVETSEQLRLTRALIDSDPTVIVLQRAARPVDATGGVSAGDAPAPQPSFNAFFGAKVQDDLPMQTTQGDRVVAYYTLVAMPGTDIQVGDRFTDHGTEYLVTRVSKHLSYEVKADVQTYYGGYR